MRILALDTSTECCSAALLVDGAVELRQTLTERGHAGLILPMIDELLEASGLQLEALDGLAFGRGPGAFTGLRIAAGVVQGLAIATGLRIAAVSSLAAVAEQVPAAPGEAILVCNDARMGEVYRAVFVRESAGSLRIVGTERVMLPASIALADCGAGPVLHVAGNALQRYPELAARLPDAGLQIHDSLYPRADAIARLGLAEFAAGRALSAPQAVPVYVRDDVARRAVMPVS